MSIRFSADFTAVYIHEPLGHTVPALNTAWSVAGWYRREALAPAGRRNTLIVALYGTTAAGSWVGLYMNDDGTSCRLEGWAGTPTSVVTSGSTYPLEALRNRPLAIDYNAAGTVRLLVDGLPVLTMAFTPAPGTAGERSLQWGGYGELDDFTDSSITRWRMWTRVLTEAEHRAEHRSTVPVSRVGLIHDWPMVTGSGRFNDTIEGEPDLAENPLVPVTDGDEFILHPSVYGTPQFINLGDSATPGPQSITVPRFAEAVALLMHATDDLTPPIEFSSVTSDFADTFSLTEMASTASAMAGAAAVARVLSYGTGRSFTPVLTGASTLAGAGAWVVFLQDVAAGTFPTGTDVAEATGVSGNEPGSASASGLANGLAVVADTHLSEFAGVYPGNEAGWESLATGQSGPGGTVGYYAPSRLRQRAITADGAVTATTQDPLGSAIMLVTVAARALVTVAPTAPVVEPSDVTNSGNNTAQSSWAVSTPALAIGDLLTINLGWDDSTTISSVTAPAGPNGETAVLIDGPEASASTEVRCAAWRYIATGAWSAGTLAFAPVGGSEQWTASVIKVPAGEFDATTPIGAAETRASAGVAETQVLSPAYNLGASDGGGRLVAWLVADDDPFIADATGWTQLANVDRGAVAGLLAARDLQTSDSEAVTAGTWRIAGDSWCALAYVIRKPVTGQLLTAQGAAEASASAALALAKAMAAHGAGVATASAGLQVVKPLAAAALAAADADAELQVVTAPVELQANAAAVAGASASLLKGATLTAAGVAVVSSGASMAHAVPVHASGAALAVAGADLAVAVTLGGVGLAQAAASASLHLSKALGASGAAQAGGAATLATSSSNDLAAAGGAIAQATAVLSVLVTLTAQAVAQAQASATVGLAKPLGAAGGAQADGDAGLIVSSANDLIALGVAGAQAAASLWLDVPLNAAALAQAGSGGVLTLTVPLRAAALGQVSATAQLSGAINLAAAGAAGSSAQAQLQVLGPVLEFSRGVRARNAPRHWRAKSPIRSWRATP